MNPEITIHTSKNEFGVAFRYALRVSRTATSVLGETVPLYRLTPEEMARARQSPNPRDKGGVPDER